MTTDQQPPSTRNRRLWLIPLGCGCGCAGLITAIILVSVFGISSLFQGLLKSSGAYQTYQMASERLKTNPAAIAALGEPVSPGWVSNVKTNETPTDGVTCLRFGVNGSRTSGTAYVEAEKVRGAWNYYHFTLNVNGQPEPIVLVKPPADRPPSLCPDFDTETDPSLPPIAPSTDSVRNNAPIAPLT
ncbi:hypothetical protein H6G89_04925 [Oscillatoria sp. FACHB-1407]|uniref:cytochrome c oxidase assembly factor Coa1 family protein n=1 Tax=Oscillatoria sp. FACHB-1407 TaxID=2692847 RepID=UPI001683A600|nr:cytochrome c oxidase assembly factor Coa1 family protein [Oscillatoria sp. FACHB-1407]MBD2460381.1 hypothetical protein [Oscillatoria sp. FACHB-1407]